MRSNILQCVSIGLSLAKIADTVLRLGDARKSRATHSLAFQLLASSSTFIHCSVKTSVKNMGGPMYILMFGYVFTHIPICTFFKISFYYLEKPRRKSVKH